MTYNQFCAAFAQEFDCTLSVAELRIYDVLMDAVNNQRSIPGFGDFMQTSFPSMYDEDTQITLPAHTAVTIETLPLPKDFSTVFSTFPMPLDTDQKRVFWKMGSILVNGSNLDFRGFGIIYPEIIGSNRDMVTNVLYPSHRRVTFRQDIPTYRRPRPNNYDSAVFPEIISFSNGRPDYYLPSDAGLYNGWTYPPTPSLPIPCGGGW